MNREGDATHTQPRTVKERIAALTEWIRENERYASAAALLTGFIWDSFTLTRVDALFDNLILSGYLSIAALAIALLTLLDAGVLRGKFLLRNRAWLLLIMQFAFGGLFSGYVIFYSRSGSLFGSWPFLLGLATLLIGNEFFRARYERFTFRAGVLYTALFSFVIFYVPVVIGRMGDFVFLGSGLLSIALMWLYAYGLYRLVPALILQSRRTLAFSIGAIFVIFNVLYFSNAIPPIPLSLKDIGVYHSVTRLEPSGYRVTFEKSPWYMFWRDSSSTFHRSAGEPLYCYTAVFAPTDLDTTIFHRWEFYNEIQGTWTDAGRIAFPISGGRNEGYRGYTIKTVSPGWWRCSVETGRGQLLGRTRVEVVPAASRSALETGVR